MTVLLGVEKIFEICLLQRKGHCSERSKMRTTRRHADSANSPRDVPSRHDEAGVLDKT